MLLISCKCHIFSVSGILSIKCTIFFNLRLKLKHLATRHFPADGKAEILVFSSFTFSNFTLLPGKIELELNWDKMWNPCKWI